MPYEIIFSAYEFELSMSFLYSLILPLLTSGEKLVSHYTGAEIAPHNAYNTPWIGRYPSGFL